MNELIEEKQELIIQFPTLVLLELLLPQKEDTYVLELVLLESCLCSAMLNSSYKVIEALQIGRWFESVYKHDPLFLA